MTATANTANRVRQMTTSAVLSALAVVLALTVRFSLLPAAPFLLYEPSDVPLLLGAFRLSPMWITAMSAVVAVALAMVGSGGVVGAISRFVGSAALAVTVALVYRRLVEHGHGKLKSVLLGIVIYTLAEVVLTILLGPLFFGNMSTALSMILPVVVPFNLLKGIINCIVALLVESAIGAVTHAKDAK